MVSMAHAELCMANMEIVVRSAVGHFAFAGLTAEVDHSALVACWADCSEGSFGCSVDQLP